MGRSSFVEVSVTLRLEVVDHAALVAAVERVDGPAVDAVDTALRAVPANCVGRLVNASRLLQDLPGVVAAGSTVSADDWGERP